MPESWKHSRWEGTMQLYNMTSHTQMLVRTNLSFRHVDKVFSVYVADVWCSPLTGTVHGGTVNTVTSQQ